jgi:hypothetical protein
MNDSGYQRTASILHSLCTVKKGRRGVGQLATEVWRPFRGKCRHRVTSFGQRTDEPQNPAAECPDADNGRQAAAPCQPFGFSGISMPIGAFLTRGAFARAFRSAGALPSKSRLRSFGFGVPPPPLRRTSRAVCRRLSFGPFCCPYLSPQLRSPMARSSGSNC